MSILPAVDKAFQLEGDDQCDDASPQSVGPRLKSCLERLFDVGQLEGIAGFLCPFVICKFFRGARLLSL